MKSKLPGFIKYKKIPHLNEVPHILDNPVEIYEKIDGGNVQVRKINGRVIAGSRANFLTREEYFKEEWFKDFNRWVLSNYSFYNLPENLIVYGEWSAKHTLDYDPEFTNKFFLLDIFNINVNQFVFYDRAKDKLSELGINDMIYLKKLSEEYVGAKDLERMIFNSSYRKGDKEGLVIKNYNSQSFAKLWTSSVKRKGIITPEDVSSIYLSLKDAGLEVTENILIKEINKEFHKTKRKVNFKNIIKAVENFYAN